MQTRREILKNLTVLTTGSLLPVTARNALAMHDAVIGALDSGEKSPLESRAEGTTTPTIPAIYSTDLFHPPDDPDDHVDLATLFSLPELDVRAIILDLGHQQRGKPGEIPVRQMAALTGRQVPSAPGLLGPLRYPEDKAENQLGGVDRAVELILQTLRDSDRRVYIFSTGSTRDVAAAFNRDEVLFHDKVERVYVNAGNSAGSPTEWNTLLDPQAYIRLMSSDLPVYWCPAFGPGATFEALSARELGPQQYATYWKFVQGKVFDSLARPLQNYFLYALGRKVPQIEDPLTYLSRTPEDKLKDREWKKTRNMWCTGPFIHAAGRQVYRRGDSWAALPAPAPGFQLSPVYDFIRARVEINREMKTTLDVSEEGSKFRVFHLLDPDNYERAMTTGLRALLAEMSLVDFASGASGS